MTLKPPAQLTHVQMEAASKCSRCPRKIPLLAFAFLDERYAAVCGECAARAYNEMAMREAAREAASRMRTGRAP